jgi:hypothetical protein
VAATYRRECALVAGQRVLLHFFARQVPLFGDQFRSTELGDLLIAIAVQPLLGFVSRRGESELLTDRHRRRDRNLTHVLHPAGHDQIGRTRHDRLGAKGNRLLTGTALPVHGDAGNLLGIAGGQPREPGDVARLPPDGVDAAGDHILNRGGVDIDPVEQSAPRVSTQVDGMYPGQCAVALANRGTYSVNDVRLSH